MKHKHYTNKQRAAFHLLFNHYVDAHVATYIGLACLCGEWKRNTRLAASIAELRASGVAIITSTDEGRQARYTLSYDEQEPILLALLGLQSKDEVTVHPHVS